MVRDRTVEAIDGSVIPLTIDTVCVHGDTPDAANLAAGIRRALVESGIEVRRCAASSVQLARLVSSTSNRLSTFPTIVSAALSGIQSGKALYAVESLAAVRAARSRWRSAQT